MPDLNDIYLMLFSTVVGYLLGYLSMGSLAKKTKAIVTPPVMHTGPYVETALGNIYFSQITANIEQLKALHSRLLVKSKTFMGDGQPLEETASEYLSIPINVCKKHFVIGQYPGGVKFELLNTLSLVIQALQLEKEKNNQLQ